MPKNSYLDRKERHETLLGLLQSRESWTSAELSRVLKVAPRTLMRDLSELSQTGVPIESDRGRGGGIRLSQRWGLGRLQLSHEEILDLLLALAAMEKMKSPIMLKSLRSLRYKLVHAFPDRQKNRVLQLRNRLQIGEAASREVLQGYASPSDSVLAPVHTAFIEMRRLKIKYTSEKKESLWRVIEPHYLLLNWPIWYVQAWDHLREDVRFFRIDRITTAELLNDHFGARPSAKFKESVAEFFEHI